MTESGIATFLGSVRTRRNLGTSGPRWDRSKDNIGEESKQMPCPCIEEIMNACGAMNHDGTKAACNEGREEVGPRLGGEWWYGESGGV